MERDIKFEVQFLLSLTLVIFGLISVREIGTSINKWIGIGEIFLLAVYFSIFNIVYGFKRSLPMEIDFVESLDRLARPVLLLLTAGFAYFISHVVFAVFHDYVFLNYSFTSAPRIMVIKYVAPIIPIGVMTMVLNIFVLNPFKKYNNITVKVIPKSIRIFPGVNDSRPLTVKIENDGEEPISWDLAFSLPEDITLHRDGSVFTGEFSEEGELDPGHAYRKSFEFSHISQAPTNEIITVDIDFGGASQTEEIDAELVT